MKDRPLLCLKEFYIRWQCDFNYHYITKAKILELTYTPNNKTNQCAKLRLLTNYNTMALMFYGSPAI